MIATGPLDNSDLDYFGKKNRITRRTYLFDPDFLKASHSSMRKLRRLLISGFANFLDVSPMRSSSVMVFLGSSDAQIGYGLFSCKLSLPTNVFVY